MKKLEQRITELEKKSRKMINPNFICECGEELELIPVGNYLNDDLKGCYIRGEICPDCPLNKINNLKKAALRIRTCNVNSKILWSMVK